MATNSQKQIIAVLTGDKQTAQCCNVINDNVKIQDAYRMVADEMTKITGLKFHRNQIKKSDMIDGYGAGRKLVEKQLKEDLKEFYSDKVVDAFYTACNTVCPMASRTKELFMAIWDETKTEFNWTLPDGFKVTYKPRESRTITINPFGLGEISMIATMVCATTRSTGLGVNVIHSVDAYIARQMVIRCSFQVIPIHDGFRCLPNNAKRMKEIYNEILGEIADSTLLEDIIESISGKRIVINKEFTSTDICTSLYSLC